MKQETVRHNHGAEKIHALTSLRFFAALFVVLFHTTSLFLPWVQGNLLARVLGLGNVSVSFFFLLSGYILGVVYLRRGGPVAAFSFYKARFARVYPLFFLTLVLDTPFLFFDRWSKYGLSGAALKTAATFAANLLMLQAWFLRLRGIDDPNWSLSVETLFYLIFPFVGAVLWKLRGARLWLAATLFYFAGQALVFYAAQHIEGSATSFFPYLHLTTFALGILLARWQSLRKLQDGISQTPSLPVILLVLLLALGAFGVTAYWSPGLNSSNLSDGLLAPLFAVVIWAFSYPDWFLAKLLSASWLVVLGEASYGLYLIHIPVLHLFLQLGWVRVPMLFPAYLAIAIGLSVLSFYYFETPTRRWLLQQRKIHVKETMEMASDAQ